MNELTTTDTSPIDPNKSKGNMSNEVMALSGLLSITNQIPREPARAQSVPVIIVNDDPVMPETTLIPMPAVISSGVTEPFEPVVIKPLPKIISGAGVFFTGRICAGKDYCAAQAGKQIFGLADPLYYLVTHFFGMPVDANAGKDAPGVRQFLQTVGQWGRGTLDAKYPLTTERAIFCTMIRSLAAAGVIAGHSVEWNTYGRNEDIWLNALILRAVGASNAATTNVRFENEFKRMKAEGWQAWHVMTSPASWTRRLAERKLTPQSPEVNDISEKLAAGLDAQVQRKISQQRAGTKLHVIWNDSTPPPSSRFYTVAEFLKEINP